ncbi:MAG: hypothetical protein LBU34_00225 [Planctomycetaceae bacterium]|jgi:hypothetical protein|nr:hypothetical protein [Planctomycetaceae bacterium]
MAHYTDWLPTTRTAQLVMAKDWQNVLLTSYSLWEIPPHVTSELTQLILTAEHALETAQNETTRTPVANAQCKTAFDALTAKMRDIKKRYFLTPPLADADYISLGLKPHDPTPTPGKIPTAQTTIETYLVGRHEIGVKIIYVTGNPNDPENKGYRIWYSTIAPGENPPANPNDLRKSFYTKRKKDVIEFDFGDSGKTVYFAVQIENDGKKGPWGPLVSALIP